MAAAVASGGLVLLSTSQTDRIEVDSRLGRWKRLRLAIRESASLHEKELSKNHSRFYMAMVTLTYAPENDPEPKDLSKYLDCVKKWSLRRKIECRYVWVGELQNRGALHYHIIFWMPKGISMPKPDKQGWWKWGMSKIEAAKSSVGYLTKYASKLRSKMSDTSFPKGYRMHGCGGLDQSGREERSFALLPEWAQEHGTPETKLRRAKGGGVFSRITGEHWASPWRVLFVRFVPGVGPVITIERT